MKTIQTVQENSKLNLKQHLPLKISVIETAPPFNILQKDGRITGMYVEFWRLWSQYNDREVEFITGDFKSNLADLKKSRVDFHSGLFKSQKRTAWAEFSLPIHQVRTSLYFYEKHHKLTPLTKMNGKRIAVQKDSYQADYFTKKYPNIKFIEFNNNYTIINQLLEGEFDALIGEEPYIDTLLSKFGVSGILSKNTDALLTNLVYALFPKDKKYLIDEVNNGIKNIPINKIIALERKWITSSQPYFTRFVSKTLPSLSLNEIEWLKQQKSIIAGSDSSWRPITFLENEKYQGVAIDYLNEIEQRLNLNISHVTLNNWDEVVAKARNGKIHLLTAIAEEKSDEDLILTEPYVEFKIVAMIRPNMAPLNSIDDLKLIKVGAVLGGQLKTIFEKNHPELKIENINSTKQGLDQLVDGEIDAFVGNHFLIAHQLESLKNSNLKVGLFTPYNLDIKMAIHQSKKILVPILNKLFLSVPNRKKVAILNRWKGNTTIEINDQFKLFVQLAIPTLIAIFSLLIYVFFLNRKMNAEILHREYKQIQLNSETQVANSANRAKDDFLANMSHELRSPMNAIVGTSNLLNDSNLSLSQKNLVNTIDNSAKKLLRLINNILDLSKIEAGKLRLDKNIFNINHFCKDLFKQEFLDHNSLNGVKPILIVEKNVPKLINADTYRLNQILTNILFNARKYTRAGSITLRVSILVNKDDNNANNQKIIFEVSDTGIGMNAEQVQRLFSTYNQLDTSRTRVNSGAGLGLRLTKALCELMEIKIKVNSSIGNGSTFYFELPISNIKEENYEPNREDFTGLKALVVDDNNINRLVAKKTLEKLGFNVITAISGLEAIEHIQHEMIDFILMDMQMPQMNGAETTIKIRNGKTQCNIPIFAFSASVSSDEEALAIKSGMNGCLIKPIEVKQLIKNISNAII